MDQVFVSRQVCVKYLWIQSKILMDSEKAYDRVDREALWSVLQIYGIGGRLMRAINVFMRAVGHVLGLEGVRVFGLK